MAGINKVILVGNVGQDPEVKTIGRDSTKVCNLSIATSQSWRDKNSGEKKERTEWHRIVIWNENLIEIVDKYVRKGDKLYIEGELQTRKWEKDGQDHYSTEIVLTGFNCTLQMLSSKGEGGSKNDNAERPGNRTTRGKTYAEESGRGQDIDPELQRELDDEIPF